MPQAFTPEPTERTDRLAERIPGVVVTVTWTNPNPDTIWNRLAARLGREPTNAEGAEEVKRILRS